MRPEPHLGEWPDAERRRACRELLRHLAHPRVLRRNALVQEVLRVRGADESLDDDALTSAVRDLVDAVLATLPARQQTIVRRCDIGGERYADVARELFVSERHAFRERDAAVSAIVAALTRRAPPAIPATALATVDDERARLRAALAHVQALEHNGRIDAAERQVLHLRAAARDEDARTYLHLRLARLYAFAGRIPDARETIAAVRSRFDEHDAAGWRRAEFDVEAARVAEMAGEAERARALAQPASLVLSEAVARTNEPRVRDALAEAWTLRTEVAIGRGEFADAERFAVHACNAAEGADVDRQRLIAARAIAAMAHLFAAGDPHRTEHELRQCYARATGWGLTREAIEVAVHLAGTLRLSRRPNDAVALLTPLLVVARAVDNGGILAAFLSELLAANLEAGDLATAASHVLELRACASGDRHMQAVAELACAKIHMAAHNFEPALAAAEAAHAGFEASGKPRLAGSALRLQAQALAALGQRAGAIAAIRRSIERLAGRSHPVRLAEAYRVLGALSGDASYNTMARRLLRKAGGV